MKVQHNKFADEMFQQLYDAYANEGLEEFQKSCIELIDSHSVSSNLKKAEFQNVIRMTPNKDRIVTKMTNFYLSGEGSSVYDPSKKRYA